MISTNLKYARSETHLARRLAGLIKSPGISWFFDSVARHLTLQLAPARGEVYREHPDQMNSRLVELDDKHHC